MVRGAGLVPDDELLLEQLSALVEEIDPVPQSVIAEACATFRSRGDRSALRPGGGTHGQICLAELLGPTGELSALAGRAAADMPGMTTRDYFRAARLGKRVWWRGTAKVDLHST